jgi:PleD family two-component response regulator
VTVSIGGAILRDDEHWESWLGRADQCLYQAKDAGRNRTIIDGVLHNPEQLPAQ